MIWNLKENSFEGRTGLKGGEGVREMKWWLVWANTWYHCENKIMKHSLCIVIMKRMHWLSIIFRLKKRIIGMRSRKKKGQIPLILLVVGSDVQQCASFQSII